jgi:hypothetical protein
MSIIKAHLENLTPEEAYLEYINDWLTIDRMSEFYNIEPKELRSIVNKGRKNRMERLKINK